MCTSCPCVRTVLLVTWFCKAQQPVRTKRDLLTRTVQRLLVHAFDCVTYDAPGPSPESSLIIPVVPRVSHVSPDQSSQLPLCILWLTLGCLIRREKLITHCGCWVGASENAKPLVREFCSPPSKNDNPWRWCKTLHLSPFLAASESQGGEKAFLGYSGSGSYFILWT